MRLSSQDHRRRDEAASEADQPDEQAGCSDSPMATKVSATRITNAKGGLYEVVERNRREQAGIERGNAGRRQRLPDGGGLCAG